MIQPWKVFKFLEWFFFELWRIRVKFKKQIKTTVKVVEVEFRKPGGLWVFPYVVMSLSSSRDSKVMYVQVRYMNCFLITRVYYFPLKNVLVWNNEEFFDYSYVLCVIQTNKIRHSNHKGRIDHSVQRL